MHSVELGSHVRDAVTGFEGVAMGITRYLTGCDVVLITPRTLDKDGNVRDGRWVDIARVEVLREADASITAIQERNEAKPLAYPGGDLAAPTK